LHAGRYEPRGLYKALSTDGNPSFATIMNVAKALGLKLRLESVA
jgi:probable addiction module antidote protein